MVDSAGIRHQAGKTGLGGLVFRQSIPLILCAILFWVHRDTFLTLDFSELSSVFYRFHIAQWGLALAATMCSFLAIGRYDAVLHRVLQTGVDARASRIAGSCAIALAQCVGLGLLTGVLARASLLPTLPLRRTIALSIAVSFSFLATWSVVTSGAALVWGPALGVPWAVPTAILALVTLAAFCILALPQYFKTLPSVLAFRALAILMLIDLGGAALALWVFLPADLAMGTATFFTAFLIAFGAGLISGAPAGLGAFEMALFALLQPQNPAGMLVAILAFRLVYFVLPAILAGTYMFWRRYSPIPPEAPDDTNSHVCRITDAPMHAEAGLANLGDSRICKFAQTGTALQTETNQSMIVIAPSTDARNTGRVLAEVADLADAKLKVPFIYKAPARMAAHARATGNTVFPVVEEAWLNPSQFCPTRPGLGQLRRLLRKADAAEIAVRDVTGDLPLAEMQAVSREWAAAKGGERRLTMGRFDAAYVADQRVFCAYQGDTLIGFVTFHCSAAVWGLDLMRTRDTAPNGTMHKLVVHAVKAAASHKIRRLSLACVPYDGQASSPLAANLQALFSDQFGGQGLRRFKNSFGPKWETRYAIAPSGVGLAVGLYSTLCLIKPTGPKFWQRSS